jgi:hypothetical protein
MTEEAIVITENQLALIDANYFISKKGNVFSKRNGYNKELLPDKSIGYLRVKILGKKNINTSIGCKSIYSKS